LRPPLECTGTRRKRERREVPKQKRTSSSFLKKKKKGHRRPRKSTGTEVSMERRRHMQRHVFGWRKRPGSWKERTGLIKSRGMGKKRGTVIDGNK